MKRAAIMIRESDGHKEETLSLRGFGEDAFSPGHPVRGV